MVDDTRLRDRITRDRLLLAAVLVVGIAGTGIVRRQLGLLGYNDLGRIVFVLGYGATVFVVWFGWIRPLDITGPADGDGASRVYDRSDSEEDSAGGDVAGEGGDGARGTDSSGGARVATDDPDR